MGWEPRRATDAEVAAMATLTRDWYEAGATCLNLGLDYQPSANADFRELAALCRVAQEYDAIYAAHLRYTDYGREGAWREIIRLGQETGIPVHVSHESVNAESAALLDEAAQVCDLTFESYLYPAGCTHLALMLPIPEQGGGTAGLQARLRVPRERAQMQAQLEATLTASSEAGARAVFVANQTGRYIGQSLDEAAASCGESRGEFAVRVLAEEDPYALMVFHRRRHARRTGGDPARHDRPPADDRRQRRCLPRAERPPARLRVFRADPAPRGPRVGGGVAGAGDPQDERATPPSVSGSPIAACCARAMGPMS